MIYYWNLPEVVYNMPDPEGAHPPITLTEIREFLEPLCLPHNPCLDLHTCTRMREHTRSIIRHGCVK